MLSVSLYVVGKRDMWGSFVLFHVCVVKFVCSRLSLAFIANFTRSSLTNYTGLNVILSPGCCTFREKDLGDSSDSLFVYKESIHGHLPI